jgi:tRNA (adenine58-N1)-methyltransferase non-catalytic subunit
VLILRPPGEGRLITICDVDSPPAYPVMVQMNFQTEVVSVLSTLNWSTAQEDYIPSPYISCFKWRRCPHTLIVLAPTDPPSSQIKSDKQKARLLKRKEVSEALQRTREELFAGNFEGYCSSISLLRWKSQVTYGESPQAHRI